MAYDHNRGRKLNLSDDERKRRSKLAKDLREQGKFGGPTSGALTALEAGLRRVLREGTPAEVFEAADRLEKLRK